MVGCPDCGTLNRKGSKYCSNCGQRLDTVSALHCPSCDGANPPGSTSCEFCGASLRPAAGGTEDDTSAQQPLESPEESALCAPKIQEPVMSHRPELPSWLIEGPAEEPQKPDLSGGAPSTVSVEPGVEQKGNKYLRGIPGVLPSGDAWLPSCTAYARLEDSKSRPRPDNGGTRHLLAESGTVHVPSAPQSEEKTEPTLPSDEAADA
jgi:hypothetical protein